MVVLGYSTGWTPRYGAYLDAVADAWRRLEPAYLVLCGGFTGEPRPGTSEAQWMAWLLEDLGVPRAAMKLEQRSRTTVENFSCAERRGLLPRDLPAVICCDTYRLAKVRALARCCDLEVREWVHVPIEDPRLGRLIRLKSQLDAARLTLFGLPQADAGTAGRPLDPA